MSEGIRILPRIETPQQRERRLEAVRRQKVRQEDLAPIYVMWTNDVRPSLVQAGLQGIHDVVTASGQNRQIVEIVPKSLEMVLIQVEIGMLRKL